MAPEGRLSLLCLVSSAYYLLVLAVEMERTETVPHSMQFQGTFSQRRSGALKRTSSTYALLQALSLSGLRAISYIHTYMYSYVRAFRAPG